MASAPSFLHNCIAHAWPEVEGHFISSMAVLLVLVTATTCTGILVYYSTVSTAIEIEDMVDLHLVCVCMRTLTVNITMHVCHYITLNTTRHKCSVISFFWKSSGLQINC